MLTFLTAMLCVVMAKITPHIFPVELMAPDSAGYTAFAPNRTVGYPLFLQFVYKIFDTHTIVPTIQWSIFGAAAFSLALQIQRKWGMGYGILSILGTLCNPEWNKYHNMILTESLSSSLLLFVLATLIAYTRNPKARKLALLSGFIGLGILIRPINYTWLAAPILFLITFWSQFKKRPAAYFSALLLPFVLIIFGGIYMYAQHHGAYKTQSFLGHNLIGKAGVFANPDYPTSNPTFVKAMAQKVQAYRTGVEKISTIQGHYFLSAPFYDQVRFQNQASITKDLGIALTDDEMFSISRELIACNPMAFAKDTFINYAALWLLLDFKTPSEKAQIDAFAASYQPSKDESYTMEFITTAKARPTWLVYLLRAGFAVFATISLIAALMLLFQGRHRVSDELFLAGTAGAIIHGGYGVIAILQAGLPRYAMSFWPCLTLVGIVVLRHIILPSDRKHDIHKAAI